ncbi:class E sortase [Kitasatospora sp. GAS204B]|uniref:class E sortase n=1 Tax=unclassified Kitasatospora TaxID=2633591 RepID=UPI0024745EF3|nr:class E sortase [Kitasatospora sp. GAS204B]MDH6119844.1 sortase A [Kitasatospora sp. GAS204B]
MTRCEATTERRRSSLLALVGVLGELLITGGLVLTLFVVYALWWTNLTADNRSGRAGERLHQVWAAPPGPAAPRPFQGEGAVGFLHVPAMGKNYQVLIRMGTGSEILNEGAAGVYETPYHSAMPWDPSGNFALAAHRDGHGAKFHDLDAVEKGDAVVVETRDSWYVYRVDSVLARTSKNDTGVIAPIPEGSGYQGPGRYITLTTCTPVYTSRYRMAVWGSLVRVDPVDAARTPPPELTADH